MSSGLQAAAGFAASLPGSILMSLGQALVLVCVCFDMVRAVSVPRSRRRYVANTVFATLALPAILSMAVIVLIYAASGAWLEVAGGVFILVVVIYRWRDTADEDSWWKGRGKRLSLWIRNQVSSRSATAPAPAPAAA
jgi:predicted membrane channel-forming protein YqfA (hemolysin III family)